MKRLLCLLTYLLTIYACQRGGVDFPKATSDDIDAVLNEAESSIEARQLDDAMTNAYSALEMAQRSGDDLRQARALLCIARTDIRACRDSEAWQAALQAEQIARKQGYNSELAAALVNKAKLCSYAEISPETSRNQEGLEYAFEALSLAERSGDWANQAKACYVLGSLHTNLNRWNDILDDDIYRKAGEYIDRGEAIARNHNLDNTAAEALLFRSRWLQQGGYNQQAIESFTSALDSLPEEEHLTASNLLDHLMNLYIRVGDTQKALECHNRYVYHQQQYLAQLAEESLEDIQTHHEVAERNRQIRQNEKLIRLLMVIAVLAIAAIAVLVGYFLRERRMKLELNRINELKEDLISTLSRELKKPASDFTSTLKDLSENVEHLSKERIMEQSSEIVKSAEVANEDVANYVSEILSKKKEKISASGLTDREIQVIRLSVKGLTAAQIAQQLFLSVHTVNTHRQRIYSKLGVKNVSGMIRKASEMGIV